jgi:hypothetical protein
MPRIGLHFALRRAPGTAVAERPRQEGSPMMNLATMMSAVIVPGPMNSLTMGLALDVLIAPALGVLAAVAVLGLTYGFATLAAAALNRPDRPERPTRDAQLTPIAPVLPAAQVTSVDPMRPAVWAMTPTIALMLRSAGEASRSAGERRFSVSEEILAARRGVALPVDPAGRRPEAPIAALAPMQEQGGRGLARW